MDPALPPNWRSARAADGKEYYFNELTGETSWTVPTAPAAMDEAEAATAPDEKPAAIVVSDPWAEGASGDGEPKPSALADTGMRTEASRVQRTDSANTEDIRVAGFTSNFYDALGPGGFKLAVVLFSSVVVLIESAILVDKLKKLAAGEDDAAPAPAEASVGSDGAVGLETESSRRLQAEADACNELALGGFSANTGNTNYGVAVGTVSTALSLLFMLLAKFKPELLGRFILPLPKNLGMLSAQQVFYGFLLLWWAAGTGVLTFHGPYRTTGNPYFACWAALLSSVLLCADAFTKMKVGGLVGIDHLKGATSSSLREMFGLFFSSLTLFLASIDFVKTSNGAYGLSLGVISAVVCAAATYLVEGKKIGAPLRKGVSGVLLVLWAVAAILLTFASPFTSTGNGYFACWFGLACAALWVYREFFEMQVQFIDGRFKSFSCRASPNELPVVGDSLGAGHGA